jgi:hypothetical protein
MPAMLDVTTGAEMHALASSSSHDHDDDKQHSHVRTGPLLLGDPIHA